MTKKQSHPARRGRSPPRDGVQVACEPADHDLLAGHIRHEERTLFPLIEEAMPPDGQSALAAAIHAAEGASRGPGGILGAGTSSRWFAGALAQRGAPRTGSSATSDISAASAGRAAAHRP